MTLRAVYKCRLCDEIYRTAETGEEMATRCMQMLHVGLLNPEPMAPTMTMTHNCRFAPYTGSLGLADFLGWQREQDE